MDSFFELSPDSILDSVEKSLQESMPGARSTGRSLALNSLENRVYDIELESGEHVVTKFYRPGRWSEAQLLEEHSFLKRLLEAEIPVVAPLRLTGGKTLLQNEVGIYFTVFPKVRGRILDELEKEKLQTLGRYLARIHAVGKNFPSKARLELNVETWGYLPLDFLLENQSIDLTWESRYVNVVETILERIAPMLESFPAQLVHGDCHLGNTLWHGESPFFLDFDDALVAPPVQDIWMIVRGRGEEADRDRRILLEAYETMQPFDWESLELIEPLRALRLIHYTAWIAKRWKDPSFPRAFPDFGTARYWEQEIRELEEILALLP